jgi:hypothetical protein
MSTEAATTPAERSEYGLLLLVLAFVSLGVGAMFLI